MITITNMDDLPTALAVWPWTDTAGGMIVAAVHGTTPGTSEIAISKVYRVSAAGVATFLGASEPFAKDIAVAIIGVSLGTAAPFLRLLATEAGTPGGPGSSSVPRAYDFPTVLLPLPPGGGAGAVDTWARGQIAVHETRLDKIASGAVG